MMNLAKVSSPFREGLGIARHLPVRVILEDRLLLIPARTNMIYNTGAFNPQRTGYDDQNAKILAKVKHYRPDNHIKGTA